LVLGLAFGLWPWVFGLGIRMAM